MMDMWELVEASVANNNSLEMLSHDLPRQLRRHSTSHYDKCLDGAAGLGPRSALPSPLAWHMLLWLAFVLAIASGASTSDGSPGVSNSSENGIYSSDYILQLESDKELERRISRIISNAFKAATSKHRKLATPSFSEQEYDPNVRVEVVGRKTVQERAQLHVVVFEGGELLLGEVVAGDLNLLTPTSISALAGYPFIRVICSKDIERASGERWYIIGMDFNTKEGGIITVMIIASGILVLMLGWCILFTIFNTCAIRAGTNTEGVHRDSDVKPSFIINPHPPWTRGVYDHPLGSPWQDPLMTSDVLAVADAPATQNQQLVEMVDAATEIEEGRKRTNKKEMVWRKQKRRRETFGKGKLAKVVPTTETSHTDSTGTDEDQIRKERLIEEIEEEFVRTARSGGTSGRAARPKSATKQRHGLFGRDESRRLEAPTLWTTENAIANYKTRTLYPAPADVSESGIVESLVTHKSCVGDLQAKSFATSFSYTFRAPCKLACRGSRHFCGQALHGMFLPCALLVLVIAALAQGASFLQKSSELGNRDMRRLELESGLRNSLEYLERALSRSTGATSSYFQNADPDALRTKRCRWKLCGTGRRNIFEFLAQQLALRHHNVITVKPVLIPEEPRLVKPKLHLVREKVIKNTVNRDIYEPLENTVTNAAWNEGYDEEDYLKSYYKAHNASCYKMLNSNLVASLSKESLDVAIIYSGNPCLVALTHLMAVPTVYFDLEGLSDETLVAAGVPFLPGAEPSSCSVFPKQSNPVFAMIRAATCQFQELIAQSDIPFVSSAVSKRHRQLDEPISSMFANDYSIKKRYKSFPSVNALKQQSVLFLANTDPLLEPPRLLPPHVVQVGGVHIDHPKPLFSPWNTTIESAADGMIIVSFGTQADGSKMSAKQANAVLEALSQLKTYRIYWRVGPNLKLEGIDVENVPSHINLTTFIPQNDLLAHKACRLLVTNGGMSSLMEAVAHGVPVVGVPLYGSNRHNLGKVVAKGLGIVVEKSDLNGKNLLTAMKKVLDGAKYKTTAKEMSKEFRSRPAPPFALLLHNIEHIGSKVSSPTPKDTSNSKKNR
ncbi:unnamed protein product [Caenorhabditis auriculariae]|uniref:glucuronosyltransferase n=1 Tax=Caenorhabditis auriculariae TaxID=2777116 RepID=A0A8S1GXF1_9PELO|nr:unnamed protein product [Caenorhabditis auriculariae]